MVRFAATGRILEIILYWRGAEPRLALEGHNMLGGAERAVEVAAR